jgi:hypothetical protein
VIAGISSLPRRPGITTFRDGDRLLADCTCTCGANVLIEVTVTRVVDMSDAVDGAIAEICRSLDLQLWTSKWFRGVGPGSALEPQCPRCRIGGLEERDHRWRNAAQSLVSTLESARTVLGQVMALVDAVDASGGGTGAQLGARKLISDLRAATDALIAVGRRP